MKARISVSIYSALAMCGILFTQSCTKDEVKNESTEGKSGLQEIMVSMPQEGAESRISLTDEGNKISAKWKEKDVIYLVPKSATSAEAENIYEYVCNEGNTNTALFTLSESENGIGLPEGEFYAFYGVKEIGYDNGITYTLESPMETTSKGNNDIYQMSLHHAMMAESEYRDNTMSSIVFKSLMSIIEIYSNDISEYTTPQTMTFTSDSPEGFITKQTFMASTGNTIGEPTRSNELKVNYYDASRGWTTYGYFMLMPQDLSGQTMQVALNGIYKSETLTGINFREGVAYTKKLSLRNAFGGEGTEQDPWIINTPEELLALSKMSYEELNGKYVNLGNDIDMTGIEDFQPIGNNHNLLELNFDGHHHTISNLTINAYKNESTGLFATLYNCTAQNVTLTNITINSDALNIGFLVGETCKGLGINNVKIEGQSTINADLLNGMPNNDLSRIGGIAGYADCPIGNVFVGNEVEITYIPKEGVNEGYAGGIIGFADRAILEGDIYSGADINGVKVGGIIGWNSSCGTRNSTIITNEGNINATVYGGGIVAIWESDIDEFKAEMNNRGNITVNNKDSYGMVCGGGLIGMSDINLTKINLSGLSDGTVTVNSENGVDVYAGWKVGISASSSYMDTVEANADYTGTPTITATSKGGRCYINGHLQNGATSDGYDKEEWY